MRRSRLEQETIIYYNQAVDQASVYTFDQALIRRMEKLLDSTPVVSVLRKGEGWAEYLVPKKWIKVQPPRSYAPEKREELRKRALANFHANKTEQEDESC